MEEKVKFLDEGVVKLRLILMKKREYHSKQYDVSISTYLSSSKKADRDNAIRYKAKRDLLDEILKVI